jgi:hypothetical protein
MDMRTKVLLKRTFDLVCTIMDRENGFYELENENENDVKIGESTKKEEQENKMETEMETNIELELCLDRSYDPELCAKLDLETCNNKESKTCVLIDNHSKSIKNTISTTTTSNDDDDDDGLVHSPPSLTSHSTTTTTTTKSDNVIQPLESILTSDLNINCIIKSNNCSFAKASTTSNGNNDIIISDKVSQLPLTNTLGNNNNNNNEIQVKDQNDSQHDIQKLNSIQQPSNINLISDLAESQLELEIGDGMNKTRTNSINQLQQKRRRLSDDFEEMEEDEDEDEDEDEEEEEDDCKSIQKQQSLNGSNSNTCLKDINNNNRYIAVRITTRHQTRSSKFMKICH